MTTFSKVMRIVHKGGGPVQGEGEELLADGGVGGDDIQLNELQGGLAFQRVEPVYHCPVVSPLSKFCLFFSAPYIYSSNSNSTSGETYSQLENFNKPFCQVKSSDIKLSTRRSVLYKDTHRSLKGQIGQRVNKAQRTSVNFL